MSKLKTFFTLLKFNRKAMILALARNNVFNFLPSSLLLKLIYYMEVGIYLNLNKPTLFTEKLQWLKLHDKQEFYPRYVDKIEMREIIEQKFGANLLIPVIGVYTSVDQIDWNSLPQRFVIKCSHGSGCNIICKNKNELDIKSSVQLIRGWMNHNWYWFGREWPYKYIVPRILIEQYMENSDTCLENDNKDSSLVDYKFYCFNGKPTYCQVIANRYSGETIDFYDLEWRLMPFTGLHTSAFPHSDKEHKKPANFYQMINISVELSRESRFVRVDFYEVESKLYFGEFTLYPKSGFGKFEPEEWNTILGNMLKL